MHYTSACFNTSYQIPIDPYSGLKLLIAVIKGRLDQLKPHCAQRTQSNFTVGICYFTVIQCYALHSQCLLFVSLKSLIFVCSLFIAI